jgi:hypothetical protein
LFSDKIKEKYIELRNNLRELINNNNIRTFLESAQKMKFDFDISDELLNSLIDSFTTIKAGLDSDSKSGLIIDSIIEEFKSIKEKPLPSTIKESSLLIYLDKINNVNNKKITNWPLKEDNPNNYLGVIEILNCLKDYNYLFDEISGATISNQNYIELINNIYTKNGRENINLGLSTIYNFEQALSKLLNCYTNLNKYYKCLVPTTDEVPTEVVTPQVVTPQVVTPQEVTDKDNTEEIPQVVTDKDNTEEIPQVVPTGKISRLLKAREKFKQQGKGQDGGDTFPRMSFQKDNLGLGLQNINKYSNKPNF